MNMLLHGIRDADLRNNDTLTTPEHSKGGELKRFDCVITNPPFSQNYDKDSLTHTERFRYGYIPEGGKKADLMFLQHMLAVLKVDGVVATVMPHGVLFRGGAEGEIRQKIIEDDLLDTVIGLGPNLFYGTGIPAAILILRAKGSKPRERMGKVLFINADREFGEGRAQNYLRPQDEEKIAVTYQAFVDVEGFAKVVTIDELADNDFNCNIRRYADNAPPPEPQDVRAHLHGGVPMAEVDAAKDLLQRAGLDAEVLFANRGDGYAEWCHDNGSSEGRDAAQNAIRNAVSQQAAASPWPQWWSENVEPRLLAVHFADDLADLRRQLVDSFTICMTSAGLDRFEAAGMVAEWWQESINELQTAANRGWKAAIAAWLTTTEASQGEKNAPDLADQTAIRLLASSQLAQRADLVLEHARLVVEISAAEGSEDDDESGDDSVTPSELKRLKAERTRVKRALKSIEDALLTEARHALQAMRLDIAPAEAVAVLRSRIEELVGGHFTAIERRTLAWYDNLANKYGTTLSVLEAERDAAAASLKRHLKELGYG